MKIEEGKFYKTRDGHKVGPMLRHMSGAVYWKTDAVRFHNAINSYGLFWYKNGEYDKWDNHPLDLIEEWADEKGPVRTVTRKEIVPGVYGRVHIGDWNPCNMVEIGFAARYSDGMATLDASELRAAAVTLIEIVDALDYQ